MLAERHASRVLKGGTLVLKAPRVLKGGTLVLKGNLRGRLAPM
jgi:hypothetical protein